MVSAYCYVIVEFFYFEKFLLTKFERRIRSRLLKKSLIGNFICLCSDQSTVSKVIYREQLNRF